MRYPASTLTRPHSSHLRYICNPCPNFMFLNCLVSLCESLEAPSPQLLKRWIFENPLVLTYIIWGTPVQNVMLTYQFRLYVFYQPVRLSINQSFMISYHNINYSSREWLLNRISIYKGKIWWRSVNSTLFSIIFFSNADIFRRFLCYEYSIFLQMKVS